MTDQPSLDYDVFISYARADGRNFAEEVVQWLIAHGYKVWQDIRNLNESQDFSAEIEVAIRRSRYVVVLLTPSISGNPDSFVRREIVYAQIRKRPIIPLRFPNSEPTVTIAHLTYIDFERNGRLDLTYGFNLLLHRLKEKPSHKPPPSEDSYKDYLNALYDYIINFLDSTVFTLLPLHTAPTPEAVKVRTLPMRFESAALPVRRSTVATVEDVIQKPFEIFNDFPAAFDHYDGRVLLLGEPGAGKTTTVMAYAREAVAARLENTKLPLPLLARIVTWDAQQQPPLAEWLCEISKVDITDEISEGRTLLLLDGLDELGGKLEDAKTKESFDPRQRFIEAVNAVPAENQVLVSCRIKDYGSIGGKISLKGAVTLQPLDDAQLTEYLHDEPALHAAIQADEGLREMSRTPLLLSILTYAYRGTSDKPHDLENLHLSPTKLRHKIFGTYIQRRYEHEALKPHAKLFINFEFFNNMLGLIALNFTHWRGMFYIRGYGPVLSISKGLLGYLHDDFIEQSIRLHVLTFDQEKNDVVFLHLLLQEYFAARVLSKMPEENLETWYLDDESYSEMADQSYSDIMSDIAIYHWHKEYYSIDRYRDFDDEDEDFIAEDLLVKKLLDFDYVRRDEVYAEVLRLGVFNVSSLVSLLKSKHTWIHREVLELLRKIGSSEALNAILEYKKLPR